jgi:hypothetical protein
VFKEKRRFLALHIEAINRVSFLRVFDAPVPDVKPDRPAVIRKGEVVQMLRGPEQFPRFLCPDIVEIEQTLFPEPAVLEPDDVNQTISRRGPVEIPQALLLFIAVLGPVNHIDRVFPQGAGNDKLVAHNNMLGRFPEDFPGIGFPSLSGMYAQKLPGRGGKDRLDPHRLGIERERFDGPCQGVQAKKGPTGSMMLPGRPVLMKSQIAAVRGPGKDKFIRSTSPLTIIDGHKIFPHIMEKVP